MEKLVLLFLVVASVFAVGEWKQVPENSERVNILAKHATKHISAATNSPYHHKLIKVVEAKRQVVAGLKYNLKINIEETTCKKSQNTFEDAQNCALRDEATLQTCIVTIWEKSWLNFTKVLDFSCSGAHDKAKRSEEDDEDMNELHRKLFENFVQKYQKSYSTEYGNDNKNLLYKYI